MTTFSFTKLVVHDLDKMAAFYGQVFGMKPFDRIQADIGNDAIDEIMLGVDSGYGPGSLMLLKFVDLPAPPQGAIILGFMTDDLQALVDRVIAHGGTIHAGIKENSEMNLRVAFTRDPEGNVSEVIQMRG